MIAKSATLAASAGRTPSGAMGERGLTPASVAADEKQRRLPPGEHGIQVQRAEDEPCNREPDRPRVQRWPFSYRHSTIERASWIHHRLTPPAIVILIEPFNRFSGVLDPT